MKYLVFIFMLAVTNAISQSKPPQFGSGLSAAELQRAKNLYIEMSRTKDYAIWIDKQVEEGIKLKQVELIDLQTIVSLENQDEIHKIMRSNLEAKLDQTGFKTVDEGMSLHIEIMGLNDTLRLNHPELHTLLDKASGKQHVEIIEPMLNDKRAAILEQIRNQ